MKLTKRSDSVQKQENQLGITRRMFMRTSTIAAGAVASASMFVPSMMKKKHKRKKCQLMHLQK